jgi:hypothetical protein
MGVAQQMEDPMLRFIAFGLAVTAPLALAVVTPALANVPQCMREPNADTCPTFANPPAPASLQTTQKPIRHAHYHHPQGTQKG